MEEKMVMKRFAVVTRVLATYPTISIVHAKDVGEMVCNYQVRALMNITELMPDGSTFTHFAANAGKAAVISKELVRSEGFSLIEKHFDGVDNCLCTGDTFGLVVKDFRPEAGKVRPKNNPFAKKKVASEV